MLAILAAIVFAIAAIIVVVNGFAWVPFLTLLGLMFFALHAAGVSDRFGRRTTV